MNIKKLLIQYTDWHDKTIYINQQEQEKYLSKDDIPDKPCTTEDIVNLYLGKKSYLSFKEIKYETFRFTSNTRKRKNK